MFICMTEGHSRTKQQLDLTGFISVFFCSAMSFGTVYIHGGTCLSIYCPHSPSTRRDSIISALVQALLLLSFFSESFALLVIVFSWDGNACKEPLALHPIIRVLSRLPLEQYQIFSCLYTDHSCTFKLEY